MWQAAHVSEQLFASLKNEIAASSRLESEHDDVEKPAVAV